MLDDIITEKEIENYEENMNNCNNITKKKKKALKKEKKEFVRKLLKLIELLKFDYKLRFRGFLLLKVDKKYSIYKGFSCYKIYYGFKLILKLPYFDFSMNRLSINYDKAERIKEFIELIKIKIEETIIEKREKNSNEIDDIEEEKALLNLVFGEI